MLLASVFVLIGGAIYFLQDKPAVSSVSAQPLTVIPVAEKERRFSKARELVAPAGFINTDNLPITIREQIGKKVILVDFWTYSCINCHRVQPYLNAWHEKYEDEGLLIIGVHTPEFAFEEEYENVVNATKEFGIKYPVVLDNDYGTWRAYQNRYWPRKYLIDIDGYIVYDRIGEGGYEDTEKTIQRLLHERNAKLGESAPVSTGLATPAGAEVFAKRPNRSPETYFGARRNSRLGNVPAGAIGVQRLSLPENITLKKDTAYLSGTWDIQSEYAKGDSNGSIKMRFTGSKVYMVARSDEGASLRVFIDGNPASVAGAAGSDVDASSLLRVDEDRLYKVIEMMKPGEHVLEVIIEDGMPEVFTFTFG